MNIVLDLLEDALRNIYASDKFADDMFILDAYRKIKKAKEIIEEELDYA